MKKMLLNSLIFTIKANHAWFHSAHHVSKGESFVGDHDKLYSEVYESLQDSLDQIIEKSISMTDCESMACPIAITRGSLTKLMCYTPPIDLPAKEIAELGLEIELNFLLFLEDVFHALEEQNALSLGLNDYLSALANQHETFVYKLKQRVK
jgi:hypothetical protein